jgi:hypothetical protein
MSTHPNPDFIVVDVNAFGKGHVNGAIMIGGVTGWIDEGFTLTPS